LSQLAHFRFPNPNEEQQTMTRSELERAVSRATGDSRRTVRSYGFSLLPEEPEPSSDPLLLLDCPGCGTQLEAASDPTGEFIECHRCDAVYPFAVDELYVGNPPLPLAACA
jgi:hypothetical protein